MKSTLPVVTALIIAFVSSPVLAQSQEDRMACEGDVYELCGEQIPDQDKIVACLRKKWSKVSKECRHVMVNYKKNQSKAKREGGTSEELPRGY